MRLLLASLLLSGCTQAMAYFNEAPIPLVLAGPGGGLLGAGQAGDEASIGPMLVDTGAPITAYSDGTGVARATRGSVELYSSEDPVLGNVERLRIDNVQLFVAPFGPSGLDSPVPTAGVLGGDNLQHFVLNMQYSPTPTLTITNELILPECDISQRCASVLPFSIAGGHQLIDLGDDVFHYDASYVLLDACLEPALDPLEPDLNCASIAQCAGDEVCIQMAERYMPQGVDIRLAVSTGFPGLAIADSAYDRLRGAGSAAALPDGGHQLYLPSQLTSETVSLGTLGIPARSIPDGAARGSITIVQPDGYFGACATVARSRRLHRVVPEQPVRASEVSCLRKPPDTQPGDPRNDLLDELLLVCKSSAGSTGDCDDSSSDAHTNAYVDFEGQLPIIVISETSDVLQSLNADVRPQSPTVEGIIGTELLRHVSTTIDYRNGRVIMTCADDTCRVWPRQNHGTDCDVPYADDPFGGTPVRIVAEHGCAVQ